MGWSLTLLHANPFAVCLRVNLKLLTVCTSNYQIQQLLSSRWSYVGPVQPDQMNNQGLSEQYASAQELEETQPQQAISKLRDILLGEQANDADSIKVKEQALQSLANLYAKQRDASALRKLLTDLRPLFALIPKAKTAKIVRTVIDTIAKVPNSTDVQVWGNLQTTSLPATASRLPLRQHSTYTCSWRFARSRCGGPKQKSAPFCASELKSGLQLCIWRPETTQPPYHS